MYRVLALAVAFRMTEEEDRDGNGAGRLAVTGGECCPRQHDTIASGFVEEQVSVLSYIQRKAVIQREL